MCAEQAWISVERGTAPRLPTSTEPNDMRSHQPPVTAAPYADRKRSHTAWRIVERIRSGPYLPDEVPHTRRG